MAEFLAATVEYAKIRCHPVGFMLQATKQESNFLVSTVSFCFNSQARAVFSAVQYYTLEGGPMVTIRAREEYEIVAKGQTGRWRRSFIDATTTHRQAGKISLFWSVLKRYCGRGKMTAASM